MKKTDIIDAVAKITGFSKADSEKSVDAFLNVLVDGMRKNDKITIVGYLTLQRKVQAAKVAHNPRTQQKVNVPAKTVVRIKPGKHILDAVSECK